MNLRRVQRRINGAKITNFTDYNLNEYNGIDRIKDTCHARITAKCVKFDFELHPNKCKLGNTFENLGCERAYETSHIEVYEGDSNFDKILDIVIEELNKSEEMGKKTNERLEKLEAAFASEGD